MPAAAERVAITGAATERHVEVLTPRALELLVLLHDDLAGRRAQALAARRRRQAELSGGALPGFLHQTRHVRADASWRVAPPAPGLAGRRTEVPEITQLTKVAGPPDQETTVSALNSGAGVWLADFEDASVPGWPAMVQGQLNLKDALDRTIDFTGGDGERHALGPDEALATIMVRPRGWHLDEKHVTVDGRRASASLTDFALYLSACAQRQLDKGRGPYFCLPKLESHLEARLWNDAFVLAQDYLGLPRGTIRAAAMIETLPAAFEMDEILYELREHSAGLGTGRDGYLFSVIKKLRGHGRDFLLPDLDAVTMTAPFLRSCAGLLAETCRKRGAPVIGEVPAIGEAAAPAGPVTAAGLLAVSETPGAVTEGGLRGNVSVALQYLAAWLGGRGTVAACGRARDLAAAEAARAQVWQWVHEDVALDDGTPVTKDLVERMIDEELGKIQKLSAEEFDTARYGRAVALFTEVALADSFPEFLTLPAYERMP